MNFKDVEKYANKPKLMHVLSKTKSIKKLKELHKEIDSLASIVQKAKNTVSEAIHLRQMDFAPKPFSVYKNGKLLLKGGNCAKLIAEILWDYFKKLKAGRASYGGFGVHGGVTLDGRYYGFECSNESLEKELMDTFLLSLPELEKKIKENQFYETCHKALYELRLKHKLEPCKYEIRNKNK